MTSLKFFISIICLFFVFHCKSQDSLQIKNNNFYIQTKYHYGFIMPHHKSIEYLLEDHTQGIELTLSKPTYGKELWEQLYRYPEVGIGFYRGSLGNDEVFGMENALFSFINIPIISNNRFSFNYKIAVGLSYLNKPFDINDNYMNIAIGSRLNVYFNYGFNASFQINKYFAWINELGIIHASNGKFKSPNLGLNQFTFSSGFRYFIENTPKTAARQNVPQYTKKNKFSIIGATAKKTVSRYDPGNYIIASVSMNYERNMSYKRTIGIGLDLFYDTSLKKEFEIEGETNVKASDIMRTGIHISQDLLIEKFALSLQLGTYIYSKWKDDGLVYQRYGLKYNFTENIMGIIALKSHLGKADFIEWGIGYGF